MKKKNNILTIMKKEFARFFGDRRMVLTTLLLPGLLIYGTYSLMGSAITDLVEVDEGYIYEVSTINVPESVNDMLSGKFELKEISTAEEPNVKNEIAAKNTDLLMVFPQEFDALVASYDSLSGKAAPHIEIYYNSVSTESYNAFTAVTAILNAVSYTHLPSEMTLSICSAMSKYLRIPDGLIATVFGQRI